MNKLLLFPLLLMVACGGPNEKLIGKWKLVQDTYRAAPSLDESDTLSSFKINSTIEIKEDGSVSMPNVFTLSSKRIQGKWEGKNQFKIDESSINASRIGFINFYNIGTDTIHAHAYLSTISGSKITRMSREQVFVKR